MLQNGRIAYGRGYGMADLERPTRITAATLFDIGSTSKQFAAASTLLLAEEHKLSLGDEVRKYIPELPDYSASGAGGASGTPITIDNLMRHTSGLRDYTGLLVLAGHTLEEATTDSQALARIVEPTPPEFSHGLEVRVLEHRILFLLSVIIERVTGKPLADFARERIFLPLGMTHTQLSQPRGDADPQRRARLRARRQRPKLSQQHVELGADGRRRGAAVDRRRGEVG